MNRKIEADQQESVAIRQTVAEMEAAFNQHDADALDRHFTPYATWVNVFGERLSGRKQINHVHRRVLSGPLRHAYARYSVESILFVRPDVAVTHVRQHPTTPEGTMITDGQGSLAVYVMVKEQEAWRIAAGQNTLVQQSTNRSS